MPRTDRRLGGWVLAAGALLAVLGGCSFRDLGRDLKQRGELAVLRGNITADTVGPIDVVLYSAEPGTSEVLDGFVLASPGPYYFVVSAGEYRLAAFADTDGNLSYQPDEPAVLYDGGAPVHAAAGATIDNLDMDLRDDSNERIGFDFALPRDGSHGLREVPDFRIGELTTIDDPRFSYANADVGLWQPMQFLFNVGGGVYFLEPYDEHKIPVLFIHGALGHPGIWREMIAGLDRNRFQPWLVYYPTAVDLDDVATALDRWLQRLWVAYRFPKIAVVAHSMGGLVGRAYINRTVAHRLVASEGTVALFITMSTPWQGQAAAALGVEQAPVVAPSWRDMAPGSPFLDSLLAEPLPPQIPYHLLFTYGDGKALIRGANDGAVTLASELADPAQRQAVQVYGFDVGHGAILRTPQAIAEVSRILSTLL